MNVTATSSPVLPTDFRRLRPIAPPSSEAPADHPLGPAGRDEAIDELRDTVNKVVGTVFYEPLLRSTRNSSLRADIGHGGRGEEVFQGQLDQILAERVGLASGGSLSQSLVDRFARAARAHHESNTFGGTIA